MFLRLRLKDWAILMIPVVLEGLIIFVLRHEFKPAIVEKPKIPRTGMTPDQWSNYERRFRRRHELQYESEAVLIQKLESLKIGMSLNDAQRIMGEPLIVRSRNIQQILIYSTDEFHRNSGQMGDDFKVLLVVFHDSKLVKTFWSIPNIN